jgi:hypothetical protein
VNLAEQMQLDAGAPEPQAPTGSLAAQMAADSAAPGYDPSEGGSTLKIGPFDTGVQQPEWLTRAEAGAGKAGYDLARGGAQWLGLESRGDVAESRKLDAPLMATTAGKVGNVAGNVGFLAPAMLVPGANTVVGGAAIGGAAGALTPSTSTGETLSNISLGAGTGAAGAAIGSQISKWAGASNAARQAAADTETSLNAERDAVLSSARSAGYVVPPTAINPNATNTALESISGKAATRQSATAANQKITNTLVRGDLGLPENVPLSSDVLDNVRAQAGKVYQAVKGVGPVASDQQYTNDLQTVLTGSPQLTAAYPGIGGQANQQLKDLVSAVSVPQHDASNIVDAVSMLRNQAKGNFKSAFASGNPDTMAVARGQQGVADAMEDLMTRHLQASGQGDLANAWSAARTTIAKTYSVEAALNGNNVSAAGLAAQARRGKPMSDGMDLAAQFGTHFGDVAGLPKSGAGVSKLAAVLAGSGELGAAALGSPGLAVGGAVAAGAPYATRAAILSGAGQRLLATPNAAPGAIGTFGRSALEAVGQRGGLAGAVPLAQLLGNGGQ